MVVNINPNFGGAVPASKRSDSNNTRRRRAQREDGFEAPPAAHVNIVPAPETLRGLVDRAVSALGKGHYWDRGSILNLLV